MSIGRVYRDPHEIKPVNVGLDKERIRELVQQALEFIDEFLGNPNFGESINQLWGKLNPVLDSNAIATPELIFSLSNDKMNDLKIVIKLDKKKVTVRSSRFPKKRASINSVLRVLK